MKIFGVEILNEGSGVSIDDPVTEMQATFVARYIEPWQAVQSKFGGSIAWRKSSFKRLFRVFQTRCFAAGRKNSYARARGAATPRR